MWNKKLCFFLFSSLYADRKISLPELYIILHLVSWTTITSYGREAETASAASRKRGHWYSSSHQSHVVCSILDEEESRAFLFLTQVVILVHRCRWLLEWTGSTNYLTWGQRRGRLAITSIKRETGGRPRQSSQRILRSITEQRRNGSVITLWFNLYCLLLLQWPRGLWASEWASGKFLSQLT